MWDNVKGMQKTLSLTFCSHDDSFEPVPSTGSEPVDNRPPTQEGEQTSQESVSTSERLRSNQAPLKNVQIAMEDTQSKAWACA